MENRSDTPRLGLEPHPSFQVAALGQSASAETTAGAVSESDPRAEAPTLTGDVPVQEEAEEEADGWDRREEECGDDCSLNFSENHESSRPETPRAGTAFCDPSPTR